MTNWEFLKKLVKLITKETDSENTGEGACLKHPR